MKFKTKIAYSAVLATLGMVAGSAQAAFLSEAGTGQVLLYPYYTVQNGYDTYVSVVNTTGSAKAVKVRFVEAKASREVLDFNLYLSPYDVWVGAVTTTADGAGALLRTGDKSCTSPQITGDVAFRNGQYTGSGADDILEDDLSRTREGYLEMIEMGDLGVPNAGNATLSIAPNLAWRVTHATSGANIGLPNDCAYVTNQWVSYTGGANPATTGALAINPPSGGLFGSATLINVAQGTDYSYDPVAIEDFSATSMHYAPGSTSPSLANAAPSSTVIRANVATGSRQVVSTAWGPGRGKDAVSAVLQHSAVMNEYALDAVLNAGTDWVVTFPTKSLYVPPLGSPLFNASAFGSFEAPFTKPVRTSSASTQWNACEPVTMSLYDREEKRPNGTIDFSPAPVTGNSLCWESNVITFNNSKVLGSLNVPMSLTSPYSNGWMSLTFSGGQALVSPLNATIIVDPASLTFVRSTTTYFGLPAVGFAVEKYVNGNVGGVLSNYGGAFIHKYMRSFNDAIVQTPGSI